MRLNRILTAVIVVALLGLAPAVLGSPVQAADAEAVTTQSADQRGQLPKRNVKSNVIKKKGKLYFKGNVNPGFEHKWVSMQKKNCLSKRCGWHKYRSVRTDGDGRFKTQITAPRKGYDYWRAKVKKTGGYGTSYSDVWRTFRQ